MSIIVPNYLPIILKYFKYSKKKNKKKQKQKQKKMQSEALLVT